MPRPSAFFRAWIPALLLVLFVQRSMATDAVDPTLQIPKPGENALHILSPNLLELVRINTKQPSPARVDSWDWVDDNGNFVGTNFSSIQVVIDGQTNTATVIGFKRRPLYAPQATWDLRIANGLYLQLTNRVADGQSVQVVNDGTLWPTNMSFAASMDPLRYTPAIHVNQGRRRKWSTPRAWG